MQAGLAESDFGDRDPGLPEPGHRVPDQTARVGRVGRTEAQARREGFQILIGRMPMTDVARAREKGETQGFMKVLVDARSKQILGAAILGVGGDEAVHSLVDAMYGRLPYTLVQHGVRIHPTVSELIPTMLGELTPLT